MSRARASGLALAVTVFSPTTLGMRTSIGVDEPDTWAFDDRSEAQCLHHWMSAGHRNVDEQPVIDCLFEIRLAPLARGRPQDTVEGGPSALRDVVYHARVYGSNIGIIYVVNVEEKTVVFAHIGEA